MLILLTCHRARRNVMCCDKQRNKEADTDTGELSFVIQLGKEINTVDVKSSKNKWCCEWESECRTFQWVRLPNMLRHAKNMQSIKVRAGIKTCREGMGRRWYSVSKSVADRQWTVYFIAKLRLLTESAEMWTAPPVPVKAGLCCETHPTPSISSIWPESSYRLLSSALHSPPDPLHLWELNGI
jgi:hypothetical protein